MNSEVLKRARWAQAGPHTWLLKCALKDGGWVLATVTESGAGFVCSVAGIKWAAGSLYAAQRHVRAVLNSMQWECAASADDIAPDAGFVELADGSRWIARAA